MRPELTALHVVGVLLVLTAGVFMWIVHRRSGQPEPLRGFWAAQLLLMLGLLGNSVAALLRSRYPRVSATLLAGSLVFLVPACWLAWRAAREHLQRVGLMKPKDGRSRGR